MWAVALFVFANGLALGFDPGLNLLKVSNYTPCVCLFPVLMALN